MSITFLSFFRLKTKDIYFSDAKQEKQQILIYLKGLNQQMLDNFIWKITFL